MTNVYTDTIRTHTLALLNDMKLGCASAVKKGLIRFSLVIFIIIVNAAFEYIHIEINNQIKTKQVNIVSRQQSVVW